MKIKAMLAQEIAKILFENRDNDGFCISYFEDYSEYSKDYKWAHKIGIVQFADANMVIGNYCGGGHPFCYDFGDDTDERILAEMLENHFKNSFYRGFAYVQIDE